MGRGRGRQERERVKCTRGEKKKSFEMSGLNPKYIAFRDFQKKLILIPDSYSRFKVSSGL